jgi:hypothetical protein
MGSRLNPRVARIGARIRSLRPVGYSKRYLDRRFANNVGVSPKVLARIIRFLPLFSQLPSARIGSDTWRWYPRPVLRQVSFHPGVQAIHGALSACVPQLGKRFWRDLPSRYLRPPFYNASRRLLCTFAERRNGDSRSEGEVVQGETAVVLRLRFNRAMAVAQNEGPERGLERSTRLPTAIA